MNTTEPVSTREATDRLVKILYSTYVNEYLEYVAANVTLINADDRTQILRLLQYFEDLFDGTIGEWDTGPVDLELNIYYKYFNCKYYPVPMINKENFCKELQLLLKI